MWVLVQTAFLSPKKLVTIFLCVKWLRGVDVLLTVQGLVALLEQAGTVDVAKRAMCIEFLLQHAGSNIPHKRKTFTKPIKQSK